MIVLRPLLLLIIVLPAIAAAQGAPDHRPFDQILQQTVKDGWVDYLAIRDKHLPQLQAYLDQIAATDPSKLNRDEQLAAYINLYNATMIRTVVARYRDDYTVASDSFKVFKEPLMRVGGRAMSLDELEHGIIRKQFKDPRIHAAVVCAAWSCPRLRAAAYTATDLGQQLDDAMRRWVNDPSLNKIDPARRSMRLSAIFKWYADDFGGADNLSSYVDRYHEAELSGFTVDFEPYDWSLNRQPKSQE